VHRTVVVVERDGDDTTFQLPVQRIGEGSAAVAALSQRSKLTIEGLGVTESGAAHDGLTAWQQRMRRSCM
jgi:hypothetical protein